MSRFCSHCGQRARGDDRFCIGCGQEISSGGQPTDSSAAFRSSDHPRRRAGDFVVRHARGLMALAAVAAIGLVVALFGSSSETTPGPADSAPASEVAAEKDRQQTKPKNKGTASRSSKDRAADRVVTARDADGNTYRCSIAVTGRVTEAKDRVTRREKVLKARRAAIRKLEKQYPSGEAPADVIARYEDLLARANAQVTWTNKAIAQYNRVLRDACDPA
jgi:hypothetical protein